MKLQIIVGALLLSIFLNAFAAPSPKSPGSLTQIYTSYGGYGSFLSNNYVISIDEIAPDPKDKCSAGDLELNVQDQKTGKQVFTIPVGSENTIWNYNPKLFNDQNSDTVYVSALYFNNTANCDQVVPQIFAIDFGHQPGAKPEVKRYIAKEDYFEAAALPSEVALDSDGVPTYIVDQYTSDKHYAVNWICTIKVAEQKTVCLELPTNPSGFEFTQKRGFEMVVPLCRLKATQPAFSGEYRRIWQSFGSNPEYSQKLHTLSPDMIYSELISRMPAAYSRPADTTSTDSQFLHSVGFDYDATSDQFVLSAQGVGFEPYLLGIGVGILRVIWVEELGRMGFNQVTSSEVRNGQVRVSDTGFAVSQFAMFDLMQRTWGINNKLVHPVSEIGPVVTAGSTGKSGAVTYYQTYYDFEYLYSPPLESEELAVGVYSLSTNEVNLHNKGYIQGLRNIVAPTLSKKTWFTSIASDDENHNLFANAMNFDYDSEAPVPNSLRVYDPGGELLDEAKLPNSSDKASGYIFNYYTTQTLVKNVTNGTEVYTSYSFPTSGNCSDPMVPCNLTDVLVKFVFDWSP